MATKGMTVFTHQGEDYTINDPNIADEFSESAAYSKGDFVYYQGNLYRFNSAHSAGSWNSGHVDQVKMGAVEKALKEEMQSADGILYNGFGLSFSYEGYIDTFGNPRTAAGSGRHFTDFIPCTENSTVKYKAETNHSNVFGISFFNVNKSLIQGYANNAELGTEVTVTSPMHTAYCRISTRDSILDDSYVIIPNGSIANVIDKIRGASGLLDAYYISENGSDTTGDGTAAHPYATVNKALSEGASKVMVKSGKYAQTIDLAYALKHHITIASATTNGRAVFVHPDAFMSDSETAVEGYTKVYSFSYSTAFHAEIRLYQDGTADATTQITDEERNAYQRGQAYRCLDTKIVPCTANNLGDALTEIENSTAYKYYHDTENGVIYFSRPTAVSASYPIMRSVHMGELFSNADRSFEVNLYGIESKYMRFNVLNGVYHVEDCKATSSFGAGGFVYDRSISTEFVRCESCGTYYAGGAGDGFNGHANSTGDKYSKQTVVRLVDCWSHDSMDDGYSDHERSEIEVWGGLFEYNGKAGLTPSYGSHCSCYNVLSRRNYSGFLYLGAATEEEGGMYGQMMCFMCVAENNTNADSGYGFAVTTTGNSAKLVNCKAIGNKIGYYCGSGTRMELIDCGAYANDTVKSVGATGTLVVKNTELVTA